MKIGQKLILGFVGIALMVGVVGYISLNQLNKIAKPLSKDIPASIKALADTSHLDSLAQFIRYYDEVLTQSARNYIFTQDKKWEKRYRDVEPKLDKIIKKAVEIGDEKDKSFFSSVDKANFYLVEMEYKSIELVDNGQAEQAVKILESNEYWNQKAIYEKGLRDYVSRRGTKYDEALLASTKTMDLATKQAQTLINTSTQLILVFATAILILAIGIGLFIARSISNPIAELTVVAARIGRGKLNTKIGIKSKDEIGQLARAFKQMAEDLKTTTVKRDDLAKEVIERKRLEEELRALSLTDELTGLYNRRGFFTLTEHLLKTARRQKKEIFMLYADLDNMKEINDTLGHNEGDNALIDIANILKTCYRESDVVARIGGDEFAVIPVGTSNERVEIITTRLHKQLDILNAKGNRSYNLSVSTGITYYDPKNPSSIDELLTQADRLMYEDKRRTQKS